MRAMLLCLAAAAAPAGGASSEAAPAEDPAMRESESVRKRWEILVPAGASREYIYTNKISTHFSGEAVGPNSRSYHGLFCDMHRYLDSWEVYFDGRLLGGNDFEKEQAYVYPHVIRRIYGGNALCEEIVIPDERQGLIVRYTGDVGGEHELVPWIDMRFIWDAPRPEYRYIWDGRRNTLLVSRADNPFPKGQPRWLAVTANVPLAFEADERSREVKYPKDAARGSMGRTYPFAPGRLSFVVDGARTNEVVLAFGLGSSEDVATAEARNLVPAIEGAKSAKLERIERILKKVDLRGADDRYEKAFRWAFVSLDNLVMKRRGRGIYAGFHWFPNYWGRDSFICLPGACIETGRFQDAHDIILSFMERQQTDPDSPLLGRFPDMIGEDELRYTGADATWWLVRAAWKYIIAYGDLRLLVEGFPRVELAIEGALAKAADENGYLTHGEGETWMDAGGETNPSSPRGDRAVEVQALFHHGLLVGASWARTLAKGNFSSNSLGLWHAADLYERYDIDELERLAAAWEEQARILRTSFRRDFIDRERGYLVDHLDRDGGRNGQIRPNAILALWVSLDAADTDSHTNRFVSTEPAEGEPLVDPAFAGRIVDTALGTLILPHGIASLDPADPQFHPRHLDLERYFYDEAYHNGDVWEWLTGPAVTCLVATGKGKEARRLVEPLVAEILDGGGCVGSLREIRDGRFTPGKEEFGGATSQAWSLAEFIRISLTELERMK